ncbi:MAG: type I-E CRISPR-associated protein Cas5/CasD [Myxococcota bacterium]
MRDHLVLALEAPALSFGGETIDNLGVVRDFPARSMITGLLANALGFDRAEGARLDALQARIVYASALVREGARTRDYQTARLFEKDVGWTTTGAPEGRAPSPSFTWDDAYERERGERKKALTHQRFRDYDADARVLVALGLANGEGPDLDAIARAVERPERPLFVGRKPHLPSRPLLWRDDEGRWPVEAEHPLGALARLLACEGARNGYAGPTRVQWSPLAGPDLPEGERAALGPAGASMHVVAKRRHRLGDERRHVAGVHAGTRLVIEGRIVHATDAVAIARDAGHTLPDPTGAWGAG